MTHSFRRVRLTALTLMPLIAGCAAHPPTQHSALVGAWRSSVQFESGALAGIKDLEFLYAFNDGGTMTESSNYDGAPPVPPAYGVWQSAGPNTFEAKYEFFTSALSADGQTFTSTIRCEMFGARGEPVEGSGEARGRAERIRF